ncbi:MAG: hypothetical protein Q8R24_04425, partial [Legionellaceae bacterium]|nr:hypothetical protein [Legionellaceae bacterium]
QRSMHAHTSDIIVNLTLRIAKLCERIVYKEAETRYSIGLIYLPRIAGGQRSATTCPMFEAHGWARRSRAEAHPPYILTVYCDSFGLWTELHAKRRMQFCPNNFRSVMFISLQYVTQPALFVKKYTLRIISNLI